MFKSRQTKVLDRFFSSLHCLWVPREERGVGFLCRFCPVASRMAFWETWVGRWRSDQQHQVSQYFLHWCLLFVYLQNKRHGHLSLSLWISSCPSHRFSFVSVVLCFFKLTQYFIIFSVSWCSRLLLKTSEETKWSSKPATFHHSSVCVNQRKLYIATCVPAFLNCAWNHNCFLI